MQHMRRVGPGFNPTKSAFICCMQCTTRQVVELNCHMCDKDKGIDKFFKAQRRNPDEAVSSLTGCSNVKISTDRHHRFASHASKTRTITSQAPSLRTSLVAVAMMTRIAATTE